jgi:hypothetical protein
VPAYNEKYEKQNDTESEKIRNLAASSEFAEWLDLRVVICGVCI